MATNLESQSQSSIISALGEIPTGTFTCGGTLQTPQVHLNYLDKTETWRAASFPDLQDANFQKILESCDVSSFGKGKEAVIDKSYRDAYVLAPARFTTSFQLCNTGILGEIQLLLAPDVLNVRAELYKMNVYTAPTGCFKAHVDTPRGGNMFGSLVVCLPSQFTGGALVTRHNGEQITYDWSSTPNDPPQNIQWAAFYSDVEHEILPVTAGHRVTLTYNLYSCDKVNTSTMNITSPFYINLKAAIDHPHFLRDGGVLGFACQHAYVFEEFNKQPNLSLLLKGSDRVVLQASKVLHLSVQVRPMFKAEDADKFYVGKKFEDKKCI